MQERIPPSEATQAHASQSPICRQRGTSDRSGNEASRQSGKPDATTLIDLGLPLWGFVSTQVGPTAASPCFEYLTHLEFPRRSIAPKLGPFLVVPMISHCSEDFAVGMNNNKAGIRTPQQLRCIRLFVVHQCDQFWGLQMQCTAMPMIPPPSTARKRISPNGSRGCGWGSNQLAQLRCTQAPQFFLTRGEAMGVPPNSGNGGNTEGRSRILINGTRYRLRTAASSVPFSSIKTSWLPRLLSILLTPLRFLHP